MTRRRAAHHLRHGPPGRHIHWHLVRRRPHLLRGPRVVALLAVVGPGLLAGLSDDDPPGIATDSVLGAKYGYELLWVLALFTAALLGASVVPLSTAYSVAEAYRRPCDIDDTFSQTRLFYLSYGGMAAIARAIVLIPGAPSSPSCS